ncbi:MAG TPA: chemotaxis protein CheA [Gemmatimonadaceae bacterium]|nr:chemotaxis protein CheA [Gemmatimonadaceae bacterium]
MDTARYAELFLTESQDNLSAINHALLELERSPDAREPVGALFRAVHTVKGMSATMGYGVVAELSHEMETLLDLVRRGERDVTTPMMDTLFAAADRLENAIELSVAGRADDCDITDTLAALRAAAAQPTVHTEAPRKGRKKRAGRPVAAPAPAPPAPPPNVTIVVTLEPDAPMRGVRAYLVIERVRALGTIVSTVPAPEMLDADGFDGTISMGVATDATDADVERVIRSAGYVATVSLTRASSRANGAGSALPNGNGDRNGDGVRSAGRASELAPARAHRHIRIDLHRLDTLMNLIGELVITRGRLQQLAATINEPALTETVTQTSRLIADMQDGIMTSRMVPVWQVFDRFPRVVRDAARVLGKQVDFVVDGQEIELDRSLLDEIGDPIVHLLRNSIDHGLETPEERVRAGKPPNGRLSLTAARDRSAVVIRVTDDGKGIDRDRVLTRAVEMGLIEAGKHELSDDEVVRLIARPGFSTAREVTDISGRGVGIDAVHTRVRALGGTVDIRSTKGRGTSITVRLPVTLAIVRALLARVGDETYAIPMTHVNETAQLDAGTIRQVKGRDVLVLRNDVLPVMHLRDVVGLPRRDVRGGQVVVLEVADRRAGMVVDELTGQQEIVIKPFDAAKDGLSVFGGATILGDGVPALILDVSSLL